MISPVRLQAALLLLLACNTAYYVIAGRFSEALESVAWYALLILFLLETTRARQGASLLALRVNHGLRLAATLAITLSAVFYVAEKEWLDAANLLLWISVVALLELEIRRPAAVAAHRNLFTRTAALLYAALGALALVWLTRGEWMDAWDAVLWLSAFGALELDVLHTSGDKNII